MAIIDIPDLTSAGTMAGSNLFPITQGTSVALKGSLTQLATFIYKAAPDGDAAAPGVAFEDDLDTGFYRIGDNVIGVALGGVLVLNIGTVGPGVSITPATVEVEKVGGDTVEFKARGEGAVNVVLMRASANPTPPIFNASKARGTIAAPAAVAQNDTVGRHQDRGHGGTNYITACQRDITVIAATPSQTDMQSRWTMSLCGAGSATLTEVERWEADTGLSMFGANVVIDQNRHHQLRSYTASALPSAATAGQMIFVSDEVDGAVPAFSDGTNWRRTTDRAVVS